MVSQNVAEFVQTFSTWLLPTLLSLTLHEAGHAYVARMFGDDTAERQGRLSLNPLVHVDPVGTILLPALMMLSHAPGILGWAKPVPISGGRLKPLRLGLIAVAFAGPLANLLLAFLCALALHLLPFIPGSAQGWLHANLGNMIILNVGLMVFNLIPLPPFDGGRILVAALPHPLGNKLALIEPYTLQGVMVALLVLPFFHIHVFTWLLGPPIRFLYQVVVRAAGL